MSSSDSSVKVVEVVKKRKVARIATDGPPPEPRAITTRRSQFQYYSETVQERMDNAVNSNDTKKVYAHQKDAVDAVVAMHKSDKDKTRGISGQPKPTRVRPMLIVAPTGSGKTGMIVTLPYLLKSKKVLIITPYKVLSAQLASEFGNNEDIPSFFEKSGIVKNREELDNIMPSINIIEKSTDLSLKPTTDVVIVNAQKFGGRSCASLVYNGKTIVRNVRNFFQKFDTLIIDEAQHYPAKTWENIVKAFQEEGANVDKKLIFVTATPFRNTPQGRALIVPEERIAYETTQEKLEKAGGYIRKLEFKEGVIEDEFPEDIHAILQKQEKLVNFKPQGMVYVQTILEADAKAAQLNYKMKDANYAVAIHGKAKESEIENFTKGQYRIAVVCGMLLEGYDNPKVTLCVILRNLASYGKFVQFVGRCRRVNKADREVAGDLQGVVLSYEARKQKAHFDKMNLDTVAETDPENEMDNDDEH